MRLISHPEYMNFGMDMDLFQINPDPLSLILSRLPKFVNNVRIYQLFMQYY